ncbi:hypothetical protein FOA52_015529 [Chlamydomonas sp. UWO 241]|nr:hypothetical protein FOA52_015529 [Chlamydomonas sp. UWO 241]
MMFNCRQFTTPAHAAQPGHLAARRLSLATIYEEEVAGYSPAHRRSASSPSPTPIIDALVDVDSYALTEMMIGGPTVAAAALPSRLCTLFTE